MEDKTLLGFLIALLVIGLGTFSFAWSNSNAEIEAVVDFSEQNERLDALEGSVNELSDALEPEVDFVEPGNFYISKSEFEDDALEAEAIRLAIESVESRDFKKVAFDALVSYGNDGDINDINIHRYQDITEVKILDVDFVNVDNEVAVVEFKVKLYYFLDEDEDETERARLMAFNVTVEDLDFDDNFEDGEVNENYLVDGKLVVKKVYDN